MSSNIDYSIKDIDKVAKVDGEIKDVKITRLTAPGENYISLVLQVDLDVEKDDQYTTINAVAKRIPLADNKMIGMSYHAMKNEIKFYSEIIPILTKFSKEHGIDSEGLYAKYYGSRLSLEPSKEEADRDSLILIENLIPQGYKNEDRYVGFDLISSKAILKSLALFHAVPIALREKDPEQFKIVKEYLDKARPQFPPGAPSEGSKDGPPVGTEAGPPGGPRKGPPGFPEFPEGRRPDQLLSKAIQGIPGCAPYLDRLNVLSEKNTMGPPGFGKPGVEPWATIGHNDFWVNNMMIKPSAGQEPLVKLVDFQVCGYKSYASDLVFFLLTSVNNEIIRESLDDLLKYYHTELTNNLKIFKVDLELTYDEYLKELESTGESETKHALFFSSVVFGQKNASVDVAVEEVDMFAHMGNMIENMSELQKEKLVLISSVVCEKNWI